MTTEAYLTATLEDKQSFDKLTVRCTCGGGFAPVRIAVDVLLEDWVEVDAVFPADSNMAQEFPLEVPASVASTETSAIRVRLGGSTDAFGRVILYDLGIII